MDAELHRIEALPGDGRYVLTFRRPDGGEQAAVVHVRAAEPDAGIEIAESALPTGWTRTDAAYVEMTAALLALERSRTASRPSGGTLRDLEGGWDVSLGNVVLDPDGTARCIAHGPMSAEGDVWTCAECGAQARLA